MSKGYSGLVVQFVLVDTHYLVKEKDHEGEMTLWMVVSIQIGGV